MHSGQDLPLPCPCLGFTDLSVVGVLWFEAHTFLFLHKHLSKLSMGLRNVIKIVHGDAHAKATENSNGRTGCNPGSREVEARGPTV